MNQTDLDAKLRKAFELSLAGMDLENRILFCQDLINTEPPQKMLELTAMLTGTTPEYIRDSARDFAREALERMAN